MTDFSRVQETIAYTFRDETLLKQALTHTSYANEHCPHGHTDSNQRLEFLGDAVLGLVTGAFLYENFPEMPEGELSRFRSKIVCEESLYQVAEDFSLGDFIMFGHGEMTGGGNRKQSVLADSVEAVIGAVFLDGGFDAAKTFILDNLGFALRIKDDPGSFTSRDNKTALQEYLNDPAYTIAYAITGRSGPDHDPVFEAEVTVSYDGLEICRARGTGKSKKAAGQEAAGKALDTVRGCISE